MKKFLFIFLSFLTLTSCATVNVSKLIGDITVYNYDGTIRKKYTHVTISQDDYKYGYNIPNTVFKTFGLNFYDDESGKYIILSQSIPYIIEYIDINDYQGNETHIKNKIQKLKNNITQYQEAMKFYDKKDKEYINFKQLIKDTENEIYELEQKIYYNTTSFTLPSM